MGIMVFFLKFICIFFEFGMSLNLMFDLFGIMNQIEVMFIEYYGWLCMCLWCSVGDVFVVEDVVVEIFIQLFILLLQEVCELCVLLIMILCCIVYELWWCCDLEEVCLQVLVYINGEVQVILFEDQL